MIEVLILLLLILANGVFALSETAVVSSQRIRLEQLEGERAERVEIALELFDRPDRFLSTVQIGITLIGILAGAFGGTRLAAPLADVLERSPYLAGSSDTLAFIIVVGLITYLSLVLGELVPKRLALANPERIAVRMAGLMNALATLSSPLVAVLSASTRAVVRLLPLSSGPPPPVTEAEITGLVEKGAEAGVFEEAEHDIVEKVFRFADRHVSTLMTPRRNIAWFDLEGDWQQLGRRLGEHAHSYFVVSRGDLDEVVGIVSARDLLLVSLSGEPLALTEMLQEALFFPETMRALDALERFKRKGSHLGLVVDEYGSVQGLVTPVDLLEALVGDIPTPEELEEPKAVQRDERSWLLDGLLSLDDFQAIFDLDDLPEGAFKIYTTLGGLVVSHLGHIPAPAEKFSWGGLQFEVVDMDGIRVDKVLVIDER
ncbi:MAG: HlyC/CorC family transporter [Trueperaceae bacterium]|nr:MAG: HlyC/CorC family transporter [Trueperaceae bacterium]